MSLKRWTMQQRGSEQQEHIFWMRSGCRLLERWCSLLIGERVFNSVCIQTYFQYHPNGCVCVCIDGNCIAKIAYGQHSPITSGQTAQQSLPQCFFPRFVCGYECMPNCHIKCFLHIALLDDAREKKGEKIATKNWMRKIVYTKMYAFGWWSKYFGRAGKKLRFK